jgi:hypothetical protein
MEDDGEGEKDINEIFNPYMEFANLLKQVKMQRMTKI